jgi:predicted TIM-barrel fold metal-dependent hydrolase
MKVIDAWAQHPTERFLSQPFFDSLKRWAGGSVVPLSVESTVEIMRQGKVEKALLSAWYGPGGDLISNEDVLALVKSHPDLFVGVASVDIRDPVAAIRVIRSCVNEHDFKALRIVQWLWELPCSHALYYPLLAECVALGIPVCLQVGHTGPLRSSESGRPSHIERIALDFPDLTIVCGHIGYPWHVEMIACATKFPNVYIDTSAYKPNRYPRELVDFMKAHGRYKVLFGTNYPMITPQACLQKLPELSLDAEQSELFLYDNARRVFRL